MDQIELDSNRIKRLEVEIDSAMLRDRFRFRNQLRSIRRDFKAKKSVEARVRSCLGMTFESIGKLRLAYEEYAMVLRELDPKNELCLKGAKRLKKKILTARPEIPKRA